MKKAIFNIISVPLVLGLSVSGFYLFSENMRKTNSTSMNYSSSSALTANKTIDDKSVVEDNAFETNNGNNSFNYELEQAVDYNIATKEDIFYMMLNTIFYFDKVSGTAIFKTDNPQILNVDEFQCSLHEAQEYSHVTQRYIEDEKNISISTLSPPITEFMLYSQGVDEIIVNSNEKTYSIHHGGAITLDNVIKQTNENRLSNDENGIPVYNMLTTPTNIFSASMCIQPQEITFGYLSNFDLWNIVDVITLNGRTCYLIRGEAEEEYGSKFNVKNFEFIVDTQTGVLIKYEGYDCNGNISDFMYTENIEFEGNANSVNLFDENDFIDYSIIPY